jgi:NAD(P)H-hydrate epimerase
LIGAGYQTIKINFIKMKFFRCDQVKQIDEFTIIHDDISSSELMERASGQLFRWIRERFSRSHRIVVFAGPGNNGGDGLALARMLYSDGYETEVYSLNFGGKTSPDWVHNRQRLEKETAVTFQLLSDADQFPVISHDDIIVDAIFGSGLTRSADGLPGEVIRHINNSDATVISVDVPSGLFGESNSGNTPGCIVEADFTLTFQFPKLAFMFPENLLYTGEWEVLPIGLSSTAIRNTISPYIFLDEGDIKPLLKKRSKFDHKGNFGHGLLIAGSCGKMGSAVLGAEAALRTGIGLLTCHVPAQGNLILQSSLPEAMVSLDISDTCFTNTENTSLCSAVGVGPGLGTSPETQKALYKLLEECKKPIVIDADAINILSLNKSWLSKIPADAVLTPHPKEFERLAGKADNGYERLVRQIEFSLNHNCIVVLKGANTSITSPSGRVVFNSTGNPGMATAGSGDVLTGIILSLLAQGYNPVDAAVAGVYLHGIAGDIAANEACYESIIASDIISCIGKAFNRIRTEA